MRIKAKKVIYTVDNKIYQHKMKACIDEYGYIHLQNKRTHENYCLIPNLSLLMAGACTWYENSCPIPLNKIPSSDLPPTNERSFFLVRKKKFLEL